MNDTVKDALRIAQRPMKPIRLHHSVAKEGYAKGGKPKAVVEDTQPEIVEEDIEAPLEAAEGPTEGVVEAVEPDEEVLEEPTPYQRLTHPDGFYSRAHEIAMNHVPEGMHKWADLRDLLTRDHDSGPGVNDLEMEASGLHDEAFDSEQEMSREELAEHILRHFPSGEGTRAERDGGTEVLAEPEEAADVEEATEEPLEALEAIEEPLEDAEESLEEEEPLAPEEDQDLDIVEKTPPKRRAPIERKDRSGLRRYALDLSRRMVDDR